MLALPSESDHLLSPPRVPHRSPNRLHLNLHGSLFFHAACKQPTLGASLLSQPSMAPTSLLVKAPQDPARPVPVTPCPHHLPLSFPLILLQPHGPLCYSVNMHGTVLPQGLCTFVPTTCNAYPQILTWLPAPHQVVEVFAKISLSERLSLATIC